MKFSPIAKGRFFMFQAIIFGAAAVTFYLKAKDFFKASDKWKAAGETYVANLHLQIAIYNVLFGSLLLLCSLLVGVSAIQYWRQK